MLVEIQALTVRLASGATPRRAAVGWDSGRLAMILAVLEARCGLSFATAEVYLNVAGGYRLSDPGADLAGRGGAGLGDVRAAGAERSVVLGEIALSGEIRPVAHAGLRLKEAAKLGFETAWVPKGVKGGEGLALAEFGNLRAAGRSDPGALIRIRLKRYSWPGPQFASQTVNPRRSRSNRMRSEPSRGSLTTSRFRI